MIITRKQVLKAVRTEPLGTGFFVDIYNMANPSCTVCAVGATLRACGLNNQEIDSVGDRLLAGHVTGAYKIEELLKDGDYLRALSCYFESVLADDVGENGVRSRRARKMLADWVKVNIPESFEVKWLKTPKRKKAA